MEDLLRLISQHAGLLSRSLTLPMSLAACLMVGLVRSRPDLEAESNLLWKGCALGTPDRFASCFPSMPACLDDWQGYLTGPHSVCARK